MYVMAVLAAEQQLGIESRLEHVRRAPLAGHHDVISEVPPEVIREELRSALDLPTAEHIERIVVEHENAARPVAARRAERTHIDSVGCRGAGVRACAARALFR